MIDRGKGSKKLDETTPVDNINKNLQSFEGTSLMHEEVLPSHKLQGHLKDFFLFLNHRVHLQINIFIYYAPARSYLQATIDQTC